METKIGEGNDGGADRRRSWSVEVRQWVCGKWEVFGDFCAPEFPEGRETLPVTSGLEGRSATPSL